MFPKTRKPPGYHELKPVGSVWPLHNRSVGVQREHHPDKIRANYNAALETRLPVAFPPNLSACLTGSRQAWPAQGPP
jgi:hypothetical protein